MPKKVPLISIGVAREGKTVFPPIGQPFDFTKEEVADMEALSKKDGNTYFRNPVNEGGDAAPADEKKSGAKKAGDKGDGKNESDEKL